MVERGALSKSHAHRLLSERLIIEKCDKYLTLEGFDKEDIDLMRPGIMIDENFGWMGGTPSLLGYNKCTNTRFIVGVKKCTVFSCNKHPGAY